LSIGANAVCLELTTFTRHQQRLSDDIQISEAKNLLFRLAFDCSVHRTFASNDLTAFYKLVYYYHYYFVVLRSKDPEG